MKKVYLFRETKRVRDILNDTYDELLAGLKVRQPDAKSLVESDEYSMLHDLQALLKSNQIEICWFNAEENEDRFISLSVKEG